MTYPERIKEARRLIKLGIRLRGIMDQFGVNENNARHLINPRRFVNARVAEGMAPEEIGALIDIPADQIVGFSNPTSSAYQQSLCPKSPHSRVITEDDKREARRRAD